VVIGPRLLCPVDVGARSAHGGISHGDLLMGNLLSAFRQERFCALEHIVI